MLYHIYVHISYGVEKELKTDRTSRERCVYLRQKSVRLCPGLMYGCSSMHGRKRFQTTLSALTEFHAQCFLGLMHHSERTYRPDEAAQNKLCKLHNHVVSVWDLQEIWCLFGGWFFSLNIFPENLHVHKFSIGVSSLTVYYWAWKIPGDTRFHAWKLELDHL